MARPSHQQPAATPGGNLLRRIKRRAWAPVWTWFASCAPGLEPILAAELKNLGMSDMLALPGGVSFRGKLEAGYRANLYLRSAGRVRLRLADFRVRKWDDFLGQANKIPWEVWLRPGVKVRVEVSLAGSNLKHSGRIAEVIQAAMAQSFAAWGMEPPQPDRAASAQRVLVRAVERRAAISLDASGEHLHRRGYRLAKGPAPLREDLAAALLLHCAFRGREPLLDAMAGAGTLAIEAAQLARNMAPGQIRISAMADWAAHRASTWTYLRNQAEKMALTSCPAPIHAREIKANTLVAARENAARAGVADDVAFDKMDFFTAPSPPGPGLVVINPPYGKRLGSVRQAKDLAARLGFRLRRAYRGWRCGLVLYRPEWRELVGLINTREIVVPHGGLKVTLLSGNVPP